jgi:hypothetical protein
MQKSGLGHDTEWSSDWPGDGCVDHVEPLYVAMLPVAETTTQNVVDAQLIPCTGLAAVPSSTTASCPHDVPSKRLTTPAVFTEAQNAGDTQEIS